MGKPEIVSKVAGYFHRTGFKMQQRSPEILVAVGIVGAVVGAVMACKATTKLSGILSEAKETVDKIHKTADDESLKENYTEQDRRSDLAITYIQTGVKIVKLYAPAVAVGAVSIASILGSHNLLRKRNVALAAAYATVDKSFKEYRRHVVERFGEKVDKELRHNLKIVEMGEPEKEDKETVEVADPNDPASYSAYARFFDRSKFWERSQETNLMFLRAEQQYANDLLRARGHLFLNEVYTRLGFQPTKAGQVVGWVYDQKNPVGDNYVDFGICEVFQKTGLMSEEDEYEKTILLDFNVDGDILNSGVLE